MYRYKRTNSYNMKKANTKHQYDSCNLISLQHKRKYKKYQSVSKQNVLNSVNKSALITDISLSFLEVTINTNLRMLIHLL